MLWLPYWARVKALADAAQASADACLVKANNLSDLVSVATARTNLGLGSLATVSNLTGPITSVGAATSVASQTGTGSKFVMDTSPTVSGPTFSGTTTVQGLLDASGASAGQIKFPATQNASTNANTLDDYQEKIGTGWTPADGSGAGLTLTINSAHAIKIGRLAFVRCTVTYPVTANGNQASISGVPWAAVTGSTGSVFTNGSGNATVSEISGTSIILFNATPANITNANLSGATVIVGITYITNS